MKTLQDLEKEIFLYGNVYRAKNLLEQDKLVDIYKIIKNSTSLTTKEIFVYLPTDIFNELMFNYGYTAPKKFDESFLGIKGINPLVYMADNYIYLEKFKCDFYIFIKDSLKSAVFIPFRTRENKETTPRQCLVFQKTSD